MLLLPQPVQLPGARSHNHTQRGPLQALPQVLLPASKRDAAAAANNGSGGSGGGDKEVGKKKPPSQCQHPDCVKRSFYGYPGQQAQYCKTHSLEGMENVRNTRCEQPGCKAQPSFSLPGQRPKFCKAHALEGMEDVKKKRCEHPGCKTRASFSLPGQGAEFCKAHALVGMVNVRKVHAPQVGLARWGGRGGRAEHPATRGHLGCSRHTPPQTHAMHASPAGGPGTLCALHSA